MLRETVLQVADVQILSLFWLSPFLSRYIMDVARYELKFNGHL